MTRILSKIAQSVFDGILNNSQPTIVQATQLKLLNRLREWLIRVNDPLVHYALDGMDLALPLSHPLPIYRKQFSNYSSNLARVAQHVHRKHPDLTLIDIGANIGDSVAILRRLTDFPILCIEGDDSFFLLLEQNTKQMKDISLEHCFVGTETGHMEAALHSALGTTQVIENRAPGHNVATRTLSDILEIWPRFAHSKIVKLDTDGMDCSILKSELTFLRRQKPVLFFEYDPYYFGFHADSGFDIFDDLRTVGYKAGIIYQNNGDYLLTVELNHYSLLEDIHHYYSGRGGQIYCDICAFHEEDLDLCCSIRRAEIAYFARQRNANGERPGIGHVLPEGTELSQVGNRSRY